MKKIVNIIALFSLSALALFCSNGTEDKSLQVTEFLAQNNSNMLDSLGNSYDWIELYNGGKNEIDLSNFYISNNSNKLLKHRFSGILGADSYVLFKASGLKNEDNHLPFKLDKNGGELLISSKREIIIQQINYGLQLKDVSYTYYKGEWNYNESPTPGIENTDKDLKTHLSEEIAISFTNTERTITAELSSMSKDDIFYTVNGESPFSEDALLYKKPFELDSFLMIRAVIKGSETLINEERMCSYVDTSLHTIPVLSLSTDPFNLWDEEKGLFAGTNYGFRSKEWIRLGQVDIYLDSVSAHEYIDFKVFGNASRSKPKKSLTIRGRENIPNHFFSSIQAKKIDGFIVRACHAGTIRYRNEIVHDVNESMRSETLMQEYIPSVLYINGEYWGIYNIMERKNDKFVENHTGVMPDDMLNANNDQAKLEKGDISFYNELLEKLNSTQDEEELMKLLEKNFNVNSLLDFWCHEIIVRRIDTYNNRLWKDADRDNVWNFTSFDYDICFAKPQDDKLIQRYLNSEEAKGIAHISPFMKCAKFREMFAYRLLEYLNFGYSAQNVTEILKKYEDVVSSEFQMDTVRWKSTRRSRFIPKITNTLTNYNRFVSRRKTFLVDSFLPTLGYHDKVIFSIPDSLAGLVEINDYKAAGDVVFFTGMFVKVETVDHEKWRINGWIDEEGNQVNVRNSFSSNKPIIIQPRVTTRE